MYVYVCVVYVYVLNTLFKEGGGVNGTLTAQRQPNGAACNNGNFWFASFPFSRYIVSKVTLEIVIYCRLPHSVASVRLKCHSPLPPP